ncbi:MAG: LUD domain-containing protein, partial [Dehalococcoidales bacterium]|nr:LUD domain-containing protein [Dehalococcoidales bacterium]
MFTATQEDVARLVKALKTNLFAPVEFVETGEAAAQLALKLIPPGAKVGVAGSTSVRQIGLISRLRQRGNIVMDSDDPSELPQPEQRRQILYNSDVYLA